MRCCTFLMLVGVFLAGSAIVEARAESPAIPGSNLTIIPTGLRYPDVLKINTGKKTMMKDGEYSTVYETLKPKQDQIFVEITVDLSVDPGPLLLDTSMIRLDEGNRRAESTHVPVLWYLDAGLEPAPADSLTIESQAGLDFIFEVPAARVDKLTLWIAGLRVASVPEIRDRIRIQEDKE